MGRRRRVATRRQRWLAVSAAASVLLAAVLFSVHAYATITIQSKASAALSAKLGRHVSIAEANLGWGAMALRGVVIKSDVEGAPATAMIDRVVIAYDVSELFSKRLVVERVDVYGVELSLHRDADGRLDIDDILAAGEAEVGSARGSSGFRVITAGAPVEFHDVRVKADDAPTGSVIEARVAHMTPVGRRRVELTGASLSGRSQTPRLAALLAGKPLADVDGSIELGDSGLDIDVRGGFAGAEDERWSARGRVALAAQTAELAIGADRVRLDRVLPDGAASSIGRDPSTRVTAQLDATLGRDAIALRGEVELEALHVNHRRLARAPLDDIALAASGALEIDIASRRVQLRDGVIRSGRATYRIEASGQLPCTDCPNRDQDPQRKVAMTVSMPTTRCQDALESFPRSFLPDLEGFQLEGELAARVELAIDWANLKRTVLDGDIGIDGCRVRQAPERMSADRLRGSFEHRVPVGDDWMTYTVGPENPNYVPLRHVSRNLTRSLLTTEDSRFYRHDGFIGKQFRVALIKNLEAGYFRYGASSISMQVVKNVMLSREKTISRKLEELFLTWYLEKELTKDRILEIYVNAIEFGPGIYGIKPAAKQYFNKHPRRLNPVESAFFSSILPAPTRRFKQYCRGWAGRWTNGKIDRILDIMLERNRLDEDQYLNALLTPLVFRGKRTEICSRYRASQDKKDKR